LIYLQPVSIVSSYYFTRIKSGMSFASSGHKSVPHRGVDNGGK
jgi:hypothetical protein